MEPVSALNPGTSMTNNTAPIHLLIVEDEEAHVEAIRRSFAVTGGADIEAVGSLREYHEYIATRTPDLVLVDLNLPDGHALEVLSQPLENAPCPMLVMTSFGNEQTVVEVLKAGAMDYVVKSPEAFARLPLTVAGALREWRLRQNNRQAEAALRESQKQLKTILRTAMDGFWLVNLEGRLLEVNEAYCRMSGYTEPELLTMRIADLDAVDQATDIADHINHIIQHGQDEFETRHRRKDGTLFTVDIKVQYQPMGTGCFAVFLRDITERKRAEEELARIACEWQSTFDATGDAIWVLDVDHHVLRSNKAAEKFFHRPMCDMLCQQCWTIAHGTAEPHPECPFARARHSGHRETMKFQDAGRWLEVTVDPIRNTAGEISGAVHIVSDITKQKLLEEQLRQSQKMEAIGHLAGGVAHDFNNILAALLMQNDLIGMVENLPEEVAEGLKQIRADTERAAHLVRQLLLFSRRQTMQSLQLDLNEVVTNLVKMLQRIIVEDIQLQLCFHPTPLLTQADVGMIEQVLLNLSVNARDAMPQGGVLRIETAAVTVDEKFVLTHPEAASGRYVCMSVSDTGSGILPEVLPQIFEPFFTTKEVGKGTGLGLATVFGIVKQHQGWIAVDNRPGEGVTFRIHLPASASPQETVGVPAPARPAGGTETILWVEDDAGVRAPTQKILERSGYHVLMAANGLEALQLWQQHRKTIALLLTDLKMPAGLSGPDLARQLQADEPQLKVIYTSGYSADFAGEGLSLHNNENFLQKPFTPIQLLGTIRKQLDGHRGLAGAS